LNTHVVLTEELLIQLMSEVIDIDVSEISATANFSEYGVDSLYGVQYLHAIEDVLGHEIELSLLYDNPSIRQLCDCLNRTSAAESSPDTVPPLLRQPGDLPTAVD